MKPDAPKPILLAEYTPPPFLIDRVALDIVLDPARTRITAKLSIHRNPKCDTPAREKELVLDGELLELESIQLDGKVLQLSDYTVTDTALIVHAPPDEPFTLEMVTAVAPEANTALQGIYRSRGVYCSQCEAQGFRRITYFIDRPDVLAVYTVRLEADRKSTPILLANGNPRERGTLAGGARHYAVWHDPHPKPSYLFAIVGGDLSPIASSFTTKSGKHVDLAIYVEHGKESRAHWAMDSLKRSMKWDEDRFGREYDLEVFNIVAVSDFNMGAMENKGLNIFNDRLILASAETATDATYESIESVVAHEYFHNWTGNRITCRDWFQLCLKEGLTVYRDQEFSSDERSRTVQRIADVRQLKALQFPEDQGPLAHPVRPESYIEINNFYTPTVYEKGAELVRMIETIIGCDAFRAGMDLYFERHDGEAATIEDFLACFAHASGRDLTQFKRWYSQAGTPELVCKFDYDAATRAAELTVHQVLRPTPGQPHKEPLFVPLRMALIGANGQEIDLDVESGDQVSTGVLAIKDRVSSFKFRNVPSRPVPSLLRSFSAPVVVTIDLADDDLAFLMLNDGDLFNRWQAANRYATRTILRQLEHSAASVTQATASFADGLRAALRNPNLDDAYKAELLKLPTQSDIAREKATNVDPAAIDAAHTSFSASISNALGGDLVELYEATQDRGTFSPDAASAGRRALRNAALKLLTARSGADDVARTVTHYRTATNMTDAAHALSLIAAVSSPERASVLANFFERWQHDHLVIDTWFAVQAQSPRPETLDDVRSLTKHPLFRLTTPNKVRALIGTFATGNPLQFNRPDGAGYAFLADKVLEIDPLNPQIAARLLGAFRSWRSLEPGRQAQARIALDRVASAADLSRDCREIVSRMVED